MLFMMLVSYFYIFEPLYLMPHMLMILCFLETSFFLLMGTTCLGYVLQSSCEELQQVQTYYFHFHF